jgi:biopolymer transport protein TolR
MAFSFNSQKHKKRQVISDINITPFVDVLLVLLIIFMVAAPLMTSSVNLNLPRGASKENVKKTNPVTISITANGTIYLQDIEIRKSMIAQKLIATSQNNLESKITIRADKNLDYGKVMEIVKIVNLSGFEKISLVTESQ